MYAGDREKRETVKHKYCYQLHQQIMIFWGPVVGLWISQVVAVYLGLFSDSEFGTWPDFRKDSGFDPGCFIWVFRAGSQKLYSSSCPRWGHECWWYYPAIDRDPEARTLSQPVLSHMAREVRSGPISYLFRPDEHVRNLSGGVCNILVPHREVWRL